MKHYWALEILETKELVFHWPVVCNDLAPMLFEKKSSAMNHIKTKGLEKIHRPVKIEIRKVK